MLLVFREEKSHEDEIKAWQFWHSRQHSIKQRILDADTKNSSGIVGPIEEVTHNSIAFYWNPLEGPAKVGFSLSSCHCCFIDTILFSFTHRSTLPSSVYPQTSVIRRESKDFLSTFKLTPLTTTEKELSPSTAATVRSKFSVIRWGWHSILSFVCLFVLSCNFSVSERKPFIHLLMPWSTLMLTFLFFVYPLCHPSHLAGSSTLDVTLPHRPHHHRKQQPLN